MKADLILLAAAKRAVVLLKAELAIVVECHSLLDQDIEPVLGSLEPVVADDVRELREVIAELEAGIARAERWDDFDALVAAARGIAR